ncbi:MAG: cold shock domain-containing protein [Candidatus Thermoplasmatota archaeon]|nr:cold shock domain-containing protein [Candidatus Thermoplasmatota archaeon]MBS3790446.1 cold shock domain-containing protein [Candidatus Thermoplasmatota archaeon]
MKGTVKFFNDMKNFGFIEPEEGDEDLFVHRSDLEDANFLQEDDVVEFEVGEGERGPRAEKVKKIE